MRPASSPSSGPARPSWSITKEELRATKLRYEGCGLEVISSSSEELQPGDKVNILQYFRLYNQRALQTIMIVIVIRVLLL